MYFPTQKATLCQLLWYVSAKNVQSSSPGSCRASLNIPSEEPCCQAA